MLLFSTFDLCVGMFLTGLFEAKGCTFDLFEFTGEDYNPLLNLSPGFLCFQCFQTLQECALIIHKL